MEDEITNQETVVELRSDTFTKPTPKMLEMMFNAEVGDAIYNEDPTILSSYSKTLTRYMLNIYKYEHCNFLSDRRTGANSR